jgi:hypothetical protein
MTLAALRNTERIDSAAVPTVYEPDAAVDILYAGAMACLNTSGDAEPAGASAGQSAVLGRVERTVDNSGGSAGDLTVQIMPGQFKWDNSGSSIAAANIGQPCYAVDDESVHLSNAGGRPLAGTITRVDTDGVVVQTLFHAASVGSAGTASSDSSPVYHARYASTANIANLASFTVLHDGVTGVEGDRFLAKDQAAADENGIYVLGTVGAGSAALTRAGDFDDGSEIVANAIVTVAEGTANADTAWEITSNNDIVVDTDNVVFAETAFGYGLAAAMVSQTIAADSAGTALTAARIDHNHDYTTAAAVASDATNAEGAATSFARSDHTHAITTRVRIITLNIVVADLTAAAVSQTINFGATIPDDSQILGASVILATPFTGGGAAACTVDLGDAGDTDAIHDGDDIFAAAVDGEASALTLGIAPNKYFASATTLQAVVTSDVNVDQLTAGDCTIRVAYAVLA